MCLGIGRVAIFCSSETAAEPCGKEVFQKRENVPPVPGFTYARFVGDCARAYGSEEEVLFLCLPRASPWATIFRPYGAPRYFGAGIVQQLTASIRKRPVCPP